MKLKEMSQAELEAMNYDDIAYIILKEENKKNENQRFIQKNL